MRCCFSMVCLLWAISLALGCSSESGQPRKAEGVKSESSVKAAQEARFAALPDSMPMRAHGLLPSDLAEGAANSEGQGPVESGDKFAHLVENDFQKVSDTPLSTFSIDVDTASYSKVRQFLREMHRLPPADAVRIEELINYFDYAYAPPTDEHPFAVHLAAAPCPWQPEHRLVRVGLKGKELPAAERPSSNLVFLLDVSGSMDAPNKLPLVQRGLEMLVQQLGENDRVAIVVYAGAAGLVLPSTHCSQPQTVLAALEKLRAGGSTNGGAGIHLAYQTAREHFIKGGINRVILCSDGDFNVGTTSPGDLVRLAEENAKSGVFLSILGFGSGNHNDALLEQVANKANGNYAFIDTESEARKVLVNQLMGTVTTIAKDVKIQIEFNPTRVASYRLVGYENRLLAARDFNDDKKDAGEIGAGHCVTALYEVVPATADETSKEVDPLKYQKAPEATPAAQGDELLTIKLRYKPVDGDTSILLSTTLKDANTKLNETPADFQFATAVAMFGMLLRQSKYAGDAKWDAVNEIAAGAIKSDTQGYRAEFVELVKLAKELDRR